MIKKATLNTIIRVILPLLVISICIYVYYAIAHYKKAIPTKVYVEKPVSVAIKKAVATTHTPNLIVFGRLEAPQLVSIESSLKGDVVKVNVREGDKLKAEQVLIRIDDRMFQYDLEEKKAQLEQIKAEIEKEKLTHQGNLKALEYRTKQLKIAQQSLSRIKKLEKIKVVPTLTLESNLMRMQDFFSTIEKSEIAIDTYPARMKKLQAETKLREIQVKKAELYLEKTQLKSPLDGIITKVAISAGTQVSPGEVLVEMFNIEHIEVRAPIPTKYINSIRDALKQQNKIKAVTLYQGHPINLILDRLTANIQIGQVAVDGLFALNKAQRIIPIGQSLKIIVNLPKVHDTFAFPMTALYHNQYLYKVVDQRLQQISVEIIGHSIDSNNEQMILVKSNQLQENDQVITTLLPNAMSGLLVIIIPSINKR